MGTVFDVNSSRRLTINLATAGDILTWSNGWPVRPSVNVTLPSVPMSFWPSAPSGLSRSNSSRIVPVGPAWSTSSQCAPSNTGLEIHTAGSVRVRVLFISAGRFWSSVHPCRAA